MTTVHNSPPILSVNESRWYLGGIGRTSMYRLINAGEVDVIRVGARTLITVASLDNYIKRHHQTNAAGPKCHNAGVQLGAS
ncbi:helix-turn-helix domain-containing protein [Nocardioides sp. SR21]|uniref:helix-turn-helix domain-containing protein n=1 Tax=Nocardioides sp. SR21 TaxID=2919501 RepID=UPI001FAA1E43|nr:helix-turn-helix domain-containing protein [Nocardioides sp. SR21]